MNIPYRPMALSLALLIGSGLFLRYAQASGHYFAPVTDPVVREECGSCHLAFSPTMLPANSWSKLMNQLKNHFGEDASLDAATTARIARYLTENAADTGGQRYGQKLLRGTALDNPPLRITELPVWISKHRKISSAEWKRKDVGRQSNCPACHADAERGYYDE